MVKADFHVHTRLSKGFSFELASIERSRDLAAKRGLSAFAMTEHVHAVDFWPMHKTMLSRFPYSNGAYNLDGFRVLTGYEVTVAERADFIVLGGLKALRELDLSFPRPLSEGYSVAALDFLKCAREADVVVVAAHPFRQGKELEKLPIEEVLSLVDAIEVNGRDCGSERLVASLAAEAGLPLVGGSDAHYYLEVGTRSTILPPDSLTYDGIRRALLQKRTRVHCKPYAESIGSLCRQIKRAMKLRAEYGAAANAAA